MERTDTEGDSPSMGSGVRQWLKQHGDWPAFVVVSVLFIIYAVLQALAKPRSMYVPVGSTDILFPRKSDSVPFAALAAVVAAPIVIMILMYILSCKLSALPSVELLSAIWYYLIAVVITSIVDDTMKNYVGRPRPDSAAVCGGSVAACAHADELRSWPSGHAALAAVSMAFLCCFLSDYLRKAPPLHVVPALLITFSWVVGGSRIRDHRHRPDDVLAGLVLGFVVAALVYVPARGQMLPSNEAKGAEGCADAG